MQEELSLREILETIWNGKKIISIITVIAIVISGFLSFFVIHPTYETSSHIRFDSEQDQLIASLSETSQSNATMNKVIKLLELKKLGYTVDRLKKAIKFEVIENSTVVKITVQGSEAEIITQVANLLAFQLGTRAEITDRSIEIIEAQNKILDLEDQIVIANNELLIAEKLLSETPEKLVTEKSLSSNSYLQSVVSEEFNLSNKEAGAIQLLDEIINPVYVNLKQKISDTRLLLSSLRSSKENLVNKVQKNEELIEQLENRNENETLLAQNSTRLLSGSSAVFISPSIQPDEPIAPNKLFNIVIAGTVGLIIGVMIVFLSAFLNSTNNKKSDSHNISA